MSEIRIGLNDSEKNNVIMEYIHMYGIKTIYCFYPDLFPLELDTVNIPILYINYTDIIQYTTFYSLLEKIDDSCLLVFNECMRTQNRSDLTYNCAHHYCNQTHHKIVFEYFPFIEDEQDFMILLDFINKNRYKGKSFDDSFLKEEDILVKLIVYSYSEIAINIDEDLFHTSKESMLQEYEAEKKRLFDNLGMADPDIIPRKLHVFAGKYKKDSILPKLQYVARNNRFHLSNVTTYKDVKKSNYIIIDFPQRRIDLNDFLKATEMKQIKFINSRLKIDEYYINELHKWLERLNKFYAKASIY